MVDLGEDDVRSLAIEVFVFNQRSGFGIRLGVPLLVWIDVVLS
jgi:hypothetical protein